MKVYQSILLLFCSKFLHTLGKLCVLVTKQTKYFLQIDAGSGSVVGVNNHNEAFVLIDNVFTKISMSLKHFSVGPAGQLGVDSAYNIFKLKSGSFVQFPGLLKQVDAGGDQILAGVNKNDQIYCANMDANNNWPSCTSPWVKLNGGLKYYSCGPYSCWGVSADNKIWIMRCTKMYIQNKVATDGSVFGINSNGKLYQRIGITRSNPSGTQWHLMTACPNNHMHVSFDLGVLWVVCVDGSVHKCTI
uniref:Fish-egg lectin-like n=1 Tax=Sinocyclocheilus grahami TaxID=75366 RepID=A0A672NQI6_SINGR